MAIARPIPWEGPVTIRDHAGIAREDLHRAGDDIGRAVLLLWVDLLNAKSALSGDMALHVEKAFGVDMDTLMRIL